MLKRHQELKKTDDKLKKIHLFANMALSGAFIIPYKFNPDISALYAMEANDLIDNMAYIHIGVTKYIRHITKAKSTDEDAKINISANIIPQIRAVAEELKAASLGHTSWHDKLAPEKNYNWMNFFDNPEDAIFYLLNEKRRWADGVIQRHSDDNKTEPPKEAMQCLNTLYNTGFFLESPENFSSAPRNVPSVKIEDIDVWFHSLENQLLSADKKDKTETTRPATPT